MNSIEQGLKNELEDIQSQIGWMEEDLANLKSREVSLRWQLEEYIQSHQPDFSIDGGNDIKDF